MPVCPKCRTGYLDGENHRCPAKDQRGILLVLGLLMAALVLVVAYRWWPVLALLFRPEG